MIQARPKPVVLYDADCSLCNAFVRLVLRNDPHGRISFAALQSEAGQRYLALQGLPAAQFDSMVFVPDWNDPAPGAYLLRTNGALAALGLLGGAWGVVSKLRVLPAFLRDPAYRMVARLRYALFGRYLPRPLANPDWEQRFLDR